MKRSYLYEIVHGFENMPDLGSGSTAKFDYFADKNYRRAKWELASRELALKPSVEWMALEAEHDEVNKRHAARNDKGEFVFEYINKQQHYTFSPEARVARDEEIKKLNESRKDVLDARQKVINDFNAMMAEDMAAEELELLHRIKRDDMPALGKQQFAVWSPLVD